MHSWFEARCSIAILTYYTNIMATPTPGAVKETASKPGSKAQGHIERVRGIAGQIGEVRRRIGELTQQLGVARTNLAKEKGEAEKAAEIAATAKKEADEAFARAQTKKSNAERAAVDAEREHGEFVEADRIVKSIEAELGGLLAQQPVQPPVAPKPVQSSAPAKPAAPAKAPAPATRNWLGRRQAA